MKYSYNNKVMFRSICSGDVKCIVISDLRSTGGDILLRVTSRNNSTYLCGYTLNLRSGTFIFPRK